MINLNEQFRNELLRANLNVAELDGTPCVRCKKVPPIIKEKINGRWVIDRSSRIDCDSGDKKEKLETYCIKCWKKTVLQNRKKYPLDTPKTL